MLRIHLVIIETIRLTAPLAMHIARQDRDLASQEVSKNCCPPVPAPAPEKSRSGAGAGTGAGRRGIEFWTPLQYRRALTSDALNVAEGSNQRGARRASHYSIALGSAEEAWSALLAAEAWGVAVPPAEVAARFRQIIGTLHRVVHPR